LSSLKGIFVDSFSFESLPDSIVQNLKKLGITAPTPIQEAAIPIALAGKDILGSAQTGTGKTAAFALPAIVRLMEDQNNHVLVLTPTREIAAQVLKAFTTFIDRDSRIFTALIIGGEPMGKQLAQLKRGVQIVIGTPGRINDHLRRGSLSLKKTNYLVLDETDRMLDMGFGIQIDDILSHMNEKKQTLLFSATMPKEIENIAQRYLTNPERIAIGNSNVAAPLVKQETFNVKEGDKYTKLCEVINANPGAAVIFAKTQFGAEKLATHLAQDGYLTDLLHGGLRQNKRDRVVKSFRSERFDILVATDIAARGLDIPHLKTVINFDLPQCPEDYIHRIGRTGRAGSEGVAINLVSNADTRKWRAIERMLNPNAAHSSDDSGSRGGRSGGGRSGGGYRGGERGGRSGSGGGGYRGGERSGSSEGRSGGGFGRSSGGSSEGRSGGGFGRSSGGSSEGRSGGGFGRPSGGSSEGRSGGGGFGRSSGGSSEGRSGGGGFGRSSGGSSEGRSGGGGGFGRSSGGSSEGRSGGGGGFGRSSGGSSEGRSGGGGGFGRSSGGSSAGRSGGARPPKRHSA
jgi:superfamily II DNA/RNA helicase